MDENRIEFNLGREQSGFLCKKSSDKKKVWLTFKKSFNTFDYLKQKYAVIPKIKRHN